MRRLAAAVPVLLLLGWLATVHHTYGPGPAVLPPTQAMPDQFPGP